MIAGYHRAIKEAGYRGSRFLQAVRGKGGLATAQRMLKPRTSAQRAGLDRLLEAGKHRLTLEWLVLRPRFKNLFTQEERDEARRRLKGFVREAAKVRRERERLYPDELEMGRTYAEGAKRQIRVNAYERDPRARKACIAQHGTRCTACGLSFEERYGRIGRGFIHVHHLRPLSAAGKADRVNPQTDLVPICPNCHAMIHRSKRPLTISRLKSRLRRQR